MTLYFITDRCGGSTLVEVEDGEEVEFRSVIKRWGWEIEPSQSFRDFVDDNWRPEKGPGSKARPRASKTAPLDFSGPFGCAGVFKD